jgi:hypothetical protein
MIFSLTTKNQKFAHGFTMDSLADSEAEITIHLGLSSPDVTFDNFILRETTTSIDPNVEQTCIAESFKLMQNYPNLFNSETTIQYELPHPAEIKLNVYNPNGKIVRQLDASAKSAGHHAVM